MNGWNPVGRVLGLALLLAAPASAMGQATEPLARYVPAEGLAILVEHSGLDARGDAWKGTAAYKMLTETPLGAMLGDIAVQLLDRGLQGAPGVPLTGKEALGLLEHLSSKGFVIGYCGSLNPPQPQAVVVVIRGAAKNPVFKKVIAGIPPLNEPDAQKVDAPGGRKVWQVAGPPVRWWYEKDDAVFSFAPPGAPDLVISALEGKVPNALKSPARSALARSEDGDVPVSLMFVDLAALPPLPPKAKDLGLDAIQRVEGRFAILDKALVTTLGIRAPRPRKEVLALFDQPSLAGSMRIALPSGVTDYSIASVDTTKTGDAVMALLRQNSPDEADQLARILDQFQARTGLSLRDDLLGKVGPRMAVLSPTGGGGGGMLGMWFTPPELTVVMEVKDPQGFPATLARLVEVANREMKAAGGLVPAQPGQPSRPGTEFAEFRQLKGAETGYVLAVPPSVLPTPSGLRPTILFDPGKKLVAIGTTPGSARRALASLVLDSAPRPSPDPGLVALGQFDQAGSLPALLANLPGLVQLVGFVATQRGGPSGPQAAGLPFRLQLDPDTLPDAATLRPYLFPSKYNVRVDDASIRYTSYSAFPIQAPQFNSLMETQVLVALLLPAVQAAREAARRAQCVNNLKQIGLAMHNYEADKGAFPARAIVNKEGNPLLSWRVAILPYLDQKELFDKFHLDEPWDSPHNKGLIPSMPTTFACPSRLPVPQAGQTPYQVFNGPGALFDSDQMARLADITDGTSNTMMVVEAANAVTWTKPDDISFDEGPDFRPAPMFGTGSSHPGGINALFADGSVKFLKNTVNQAVLKALITRAGGEVVSADSY